MRPVVAFDTETWLIEPGLLAPPLVCVQWKRPGESAVMRHRDQVRWIVEAWLDGNDILVGHNVAYDMAVIAAQWPDLLPRIFAKYDRDEITDTKIREQLIQISRGTFRSYMGTDGECHAVKYDLADCIRRHFGRHVEKDGFRLFYRIFDAFPDIANWAAVAEAFQLMVRQAGIPEWAKGLVKDKDVQGMLAAPPEDAVRYALADADETLALYESQERFGAHLFADQFRKARAAFALHLSACWGLYTYEEAVDKLEIELLAEFEELKVELQQEGLIRADGTADTKAASRAMVEACREEGIPIARTKGYAQKNGEPEAEYRARIADPHAYVSLSAEACDRFDETSIIGAYSQFLTLRKTLSNDIKMLRSGTEVPIQPRYDFADTGRTRCAKPNIQAINRGAGIREAFRPRPGTVFIQADFEGLELHTMSAWCLEKVGWSMMADKLNAKVDVHTEMAADILGISYDDAMAQKNSPDKAVKDHMKEYRQRAKALNFGLPGGLGAKKFVRYAKTQFQATVTEAEAVEYKARWLRRFPEFNEFFRLAACATANPGKLANETHVFTGRVRGNVRYSALCNGRFQGLGADAATEALWRVTRACYVEPASPLYGCRVVAFVHDELILECPIGRHSAAAKELGRLMCEGANVYLSRVPVRTEPLAMAVWSKAAEPLYNDNGDILIWYPQGGLGAVPPPA